MSDLSWSTRLNHVRFSRLVLFLEKWLSILVVCLLVLSGFNWIAAVVLAVPLFLMFLLVHSGHYTLEDTAGLPVTRWTFRF